MIAGIDFGSSTTDIVLMEGDKVIEKNSFQNHEEFLLYFNTKDIDEIKVTGANANKYGYENTIDEIQAIGKGGLFVSNKKQALVVSIGSGTCMVSVKDNIQHIGGTAIGGRTLLGLSELLLETKDLEEISNLAKNGNLNNIDLTLEDIYPDGIGLLPNTATASHFGNIKKHSKQDIALALINMIAQTIGTLSVFAAKAYKHDCVILTGKLTKLEQLKEIIKNRIITLEKLPVIIPEHADVATAIGATR